MINKENSEWFELTDEYGGKLAIQKLNELAKTHYILEVKYQVASSSNWTVLSGGITYILVNAVKKE